MDRTTVNSKGVLGPIGLLLVVILWLMTVSHGDSPIQSARSMPESQPTVQEAAGNVSQALGMQS